MKEKIRMRTILLVILAAVGTGIGIYFFVRLLRKPKKRPRISEKYIFVSSVTDGSQKYFKKDLFGDPVCHDCKEVLENPIRLPQSYIEKTPRVYFLNNNTFVCAGCVSNYMYRRNKKGEVICTSCGQKEGWLQYFPDSNVALCTSCQDDGIS